MNSTASLRNSRDAYNNNNTFSVVTRDNNNNSGFSTLDIECDSMDVYFILLKVVFVDVFNCDFFFAILLMFFFILIVVVLFVVFRVLHYYKKNP